MDPRERLGDRAEALRIAFDVKQATLHTAFPAIVVSVDMATMRALVKPAIQGQFQNIDGTWTDVNLPQMNCPIYFPSGGGFTLTFPLAAGDEVFVIIAERCIDSWWLSSNVQPQSEFRMHNLSDGFCFPKVWSKPKVISPSPNTANVQLRSDDGDTYIEMTPGGGINMVAPGNINITATGNITITGARIDLNP